MKIVVIGGTGLIGKKLVRILAELGHEVISASPSTGVNSITREGLVEALIGVDVVVDVANSPSLEDQAVMDFFESSCTNILEAEAEAGIAHHIALSAVGTEKLQASGYFRAKMVQEELIRNSRIPYTIVHSTQFFEYLGDIAEAATAGQSVHLSPAFVQPIASEDVATLLAEIALRDPANATVEIAGPERIKLSDLMQKFLYQNKDSRRVVRDPGAYYFGAPLEELTLIPKDGARRAPINFENWHANHYSI